MRRSFLLAVVLLLLFHDAVRTPPSAIGGGRPADDDDDRQLQRLRQGLPPDPEHASPQRLQQILGGPPRRVARQILYQRHLEQWFYDKPAPLRLDFDCRPGQPPRLTGVAALAPRR
jgi:hypothetical protein